MPMINDNIKAFILVFGAIVMSVLIGSTVEGFKGLITLAFGAKILAILLWGYRVVLGLLLAKGLQYYFFSSFDPNLEMIISLSIIAVLPLIIVFYLMRLSGVGSLLLLPEIDFRHVLFFIILAGFITSISKFMYMLGHIDLSVNAGSFFVSALLGQVLGGLLFVYGAVKLTPWIHSLFAPSK